MSDSSDRLRNFGADTAIVLGSGLGSIVPAQAEKISYREFDDLPRPSVAGHAGQFAMARVSGQAVIFAQGRVHLYEGYSAGEVTAGVRLLERAGVKTLILTNAAGSVNANFAPGEWMMITDHINLSGATPLRRAPTADNAATSAGRGQDKWAPVFLDQSEVYSKSWRDRFASAAKASAILLHEGVYASLPGPEYETPAEVRMLQKLGADAVGMSTVLEAIQARALGLEVVAFSCLTNFGAGMTRESLGHDDVLKTGDKAAKSFARLFEDVLARSVES